MNSHARIEPLGHKCPAREGDPLAHPDQTGSARPALDNQLEDAIGT
jgi:hypothetical protein